MPDDERHSHESLMTYVKNVIDKQLHDLDPARVRARKRLHAALEAGRPDANDKPGRFADTAQRLTPTPATERFAPEQTFFESCRSVLVPLPPESAATLVTTYTDQANCNACVEVWIPMGALDGLATHTFLPS